MADQKFFVYIRDGGKTRPLIVEASDVTQEGTCLKFTGEKGVFWLSAEIFLYAFSESMGKLMDEFNDEEDTPIVGH